MSYCSIPARKRFEEDGRFYAGHVSVDPTTPRHRRRRVLCFLTRNGVVGASRNFSRAEAHDNAVKAERGLLPLPKFAANTADLIAQILGLRGFPVHNANDCVDDTTAEWLGKEFAT